MIFTKDEESGINALYKKADAKDEFEMMYANFGGHDNTIRIGTYMNLLQYLSQRGKIDKDSKLEKTVTLDISYTNVNKTAYRLTISGHDNIKKYIDMIYKRKNHLAYKIILSKKDDNITLMKKKKDEKPYDITDLNIRVRLALEDTPTKEEIKALQSLSHTADIIFRYKQRLSLINEKGNFRIDLTDTKQSNNVNYLTDTVSVYELEVEQLKRGSLDGMYKAVEVLLKVVQQSNYIIRKSQIKNVIEQYTNLMGVTNTEKLIGRKPVSLEMEHLLNVLPNRYAVTDKADGDRFQLIIYNNKVYLISSILDVKITGIELKDSKYNDTIFDGEYIYLKEHNRHVFMIFDCMVSSGMDLKTEKDLFTRLKSADEIIEKIFVFGKQTNHKFNDFEGTFDQQKYIDYHKKQIDAYMKSFVDSINLEKQYPLIRRKYFIRVYGAYNNEIYNYSALLWDKYVLESNTLCPYNLDGLIYHPIEQTYELDAKKSKLSEYKWKPVDKNSIDFYITFVKDLKTGKILDVFDNTFESMDGDDIVKNKPYRICYLHVGKNINGVEKPVFFQERNMRYIAHLYLDDGVVRDIEGNIIQDNTVVEFYYDANSSINKKFQWIPIRTRYDKTEVVQKYHKSFGNYVDVADKVWRSMINPISMSDIKTLGNKVNFEKHKEDLGKRIDYRPKEETAYYEIKTGLAKPMRAYHNWIKSMIINTYCHPSLNNGKQVDIWDQGCGQGGDILKFYWANIKSYVGTDPDGITLTKPNDGAIARYNGYRKKLEKFPKMTFIQGDSTAIFDVEHQEKVLGGMSAKNKELMGEFFSSNPKNRFKFDRINSSLALHYFLASEETWGNFCENINNYLKPGGYLMFTCTDAQQVLKALNGKDNVSFNYVDGGNNRKLYEIVKKFDKIESPFGLGYAIDIYNSLISTEGTYITEYLVDKDFIKKDLKKRCGLRLIDTDLFKNQFEIHREYLTNTIEYESDPKTKALLEKIGKYYDDDDNINRVCYNITYTYRYYVFQKKD